MGGEGEQWGPYRLVRRLGVGGMAETFEAVRTTESGLMHRVCVKRVLPAYADDPEFVSLFRSEARLAAELRHGNVVAVLDVGATDLPYLVLELVDGFDLHTLLATAPDRKLPLEVVAYLGVELAHALAYAHSGRGEGRTGGVVHRDLSPSNVLLGRGGEVKLADFGLAKAMHAQSVSQSGTARGKIPYMAPEQMRGERLDGRADLFALGVVLFEALAGTRPFDGTHDVETMTRILGGRRHALAPLRPDVPPALVRLVDALLATDPADRPPSAEAVVGALDELGSTRPARRLLASMVEARLGGASTRAHVVPRSAHVEPRPTDVAGSAAVPSMAPAAPLESESPDRSVGTATTVLVPRDALERAEPPTAAHEPAAKAAWSTRARVVSIAAFAVVGAIAGVLSRGAGSSVDPRAPGAASAMAEPGASAARGVDATRPARGSGRAALAASARVPGGPASAAVPGVAPPATAVTAQTGTDAAPDPSGTDPANAPSGAEPANAPSGAEPARAPSGAEPARAPSGAEPARAPSAAPRGTATVRIVVHPWGYVWVDHRALGRAPRAIELPAGSHVVEAGIDVPSVHRRIAVGPAEHRVVELDLASEDAAPR